MYLLQTDLANDCINCIDHATKKDWTAFLSCALTVLTGVIVRRLEKKRLDKEKKQIERELQEVKNKNLN